MRSLRRSSVRIAVRPLALAAVVVAGLASHAHSEPIEDIVRARLAPALPVGLDVARVYLPASLAGLDVDPSKVVIELPRELRAGRPSIKLTVRGKRPASVPVAIAALSEVAIAQRALGIGDVISDEDILVERRAIADLAPAAAATLIGSSVTNPIAAGAPIGSRDVALPPQLPRGTQVAIDVRRGAVRIRGTGTLELAARPGETASARIAATKSVVRGRLVAPATLIIGDGQ